jgi:hypothetical protein
MELARKDALAAKYLFQKMICLYWVWVTVVHGLLMLDSSTRAMTFPIQFNSSACVLSLHSARNYPASSGF